MDSGRSPIRGGTFAAIAASTALCLVMPGAALAGTRIAPAAVLRGTSVVGGRGSARAPGEVSLPLRVRNRAAYTAAKLAADRRAGRSRRAPATARALSGPRATLFGGLDAAGLTAAAQIASEGVAGDVAPPDTTGAIGPGYYVELVNNEAAVLKRSDLSMVGSPAPLEAFMNGSGICDPQVKYDPQADRWFYAAIRCDGKEDRLYLGFSKTSDPTDLSTAEGHGWCGYSYATGSALEDYPKLGLDPRHIVIGTNSFNAATEAFLTAHILAAPKPTGAIAKCPAEAPALSAFGSEAKPLKTSLGDEAFTPEPATVSDASSSGGYVVAADLFSAEAGEHLMLWKVAGTAESPELEEVADPRVTPFRLPPSIPQPGTFKAIDSSDTRLTQAVAAADPNAGGEEAVWTQHTVAGGAGSVVRWYELLPGKGTVRQEGTISDASKYVFNGAIAPTLSGSAVIDYDTGSSEADVQVVAQSRVGSAPLGTMNTPVLLGSSEAVDSDFTCPAAPGGEPPAPPCRWGDYAGASVDPVNARLVWGSNQLNGPSASEAAQWTTRSFALEANDLAPTASFAAPSAAAAGASASFDATASSDPDGTVASYEWSFGDGSGAEGGPATSHTYQAAGSYEVRLTVTDNGGQTATTSHLVTVGAPTGAGGEPSLGTTVSSSAQQTSLAPGIVAPDLGDVAGTGSAATGAIALTASPSGPGTVTWTVTFPNGRFGVFAAGRTGRCRRGYVKLGGRCRPAKVVYAKGRRAIPTVGPLRLRIAPTAAGRRALGNARRHGRRLTLTVTLTFAPAGGGAPIVRVLTLQLRPSRR